MSVYFITCRALGAVKIGCAEEPWNRLGNLQAGCPLELKLEATMKGSFQEERQFHEKFAAIRMRGEWFRITPEIEALMLRAGLPVYAKEAVRQQERLRRLQEENAAIERKAQREQEQRAWGQRYLAKREAAGDIIFPFREKVDA